MKHIFPFDGKFFPRRMRGARRLCSFCENEPVYMLIEGQSFKALCTNHVNKLIGETHRHTEPYTEYLQASCDEMWMNIWIKDIQPLLHAPLVSISPGNTTLGYFIGGGKTLEEANRLTQMVYDRGLLKRPKKTKRGVS